MMISVAFLLCVSVSLIPDLVQAAKQQRHPISPPPSRHPPPPPTSPKPHPLPHKLHPLPHNLTCADLVQMLQRKSKLQLSVSRLIDDSTRQKMLTEEEKLKTEILKIYQSELKATENSLMVILRDLNQTLSSDYRSLAQVKRSCRLRLDDMRNAAVKVEEDYNTVLELEREMHALHPESNLTHNRIIAEIMAEVSHAADSLESDLGASDVFQDSRNQEGAALETVVKLQEGGLAARHNLAYVYQKTLVKSGGRRGREKGEEEGGGGAMAVLVDSASNQYVLSRPRDVTVPIEDHHLMHDIVNILLLSFVLGSVCSLINVPSLLGYILAGLLLGPVGYNVISSVVQIETLGEFGVVFTVLCVALDFSTDKLRKVWHVAVFGGNALLLCGGVLGVVMGASVGVRVRVGLAIIACLSLSSAPLAHRFLESMLYFPRQRFSSAISESQQPIDSELSDSAGHLNGLLVMQDIQLGTLVALMPLFADSPPSLGHWNVAAFLYGFLQLLQTTCGFCLLVIIARQLTNRTLETFYRVLNTTGSRPESVLLGSVAVSFLLLLAADYLGASMELGCFLAGLAIGSQGHTVVEQVKKLVEPLRDFLSVFFFASLGFHIFPTFLRSEFSMILGITFCVLILKFLLALAVLGMFTGHCHTSTWILSLSLSPVSEFSFLLASRARRLDIISREVYLVILSISALSLLFTPMLWRLYLMGVSINWRTLKVPRLPLTRLKRISSSSSSS